MPAIQHEFADSESASFLHGEAKAMPSREGFLGKTARWKLLSPISHFLPYVLLMTSIFLVLIIFVSLKEIQGKDLLPSQSTFGKSTISIICL